MADCTWTVSGSLITFEKNTGSSNGDNCFITCPTPITIAEGITLVYVESTTNGAGKMTTGLRYNIYPGGSYDGPASSDNPNPEQYNYISSNGVYTSNDSQIPFLVQTIGNDDISVAKGTESYGPDIEYGTAKTFAICKFDDTSVGYSQIYPSAEGAADNRRGKSFITSYYVANTGGFGWKTYPTGTNEYKHGMRFAFIALTTKNADTWNYFEHTFEGGYHYTIELYIHCAPWVCEGISVFDNRKDSRPSDFSEVGDSEEFEYNENKFYINGSNDDVSKTFDYNPSDNNTLCFCFITTYYDASDHNNVNLAVDGYRYAYVKITKKVNVNIKGGKTSNDIVIPITPYKHFSEDTELVEPNKISSIPGSNGVPFTLRGGVYGVSDSYVDINKVLTTEGKYTGNVVGGFDNDNRLDTSQITWYGTWYNNISYSPYGSVSAIWCTRSGMASSLVDIDKPITIAEYNAKCASGENLTVTYNGSSSFYFYGSNTSQIYVKTGTPAGSYNPGSVTFTSPSGDNYYSTSRLSRIPTINISAVTVTSYGNITNLTITQKEDIPASGITLNSGNLSTYFKASASQIVTYSNNSTSNASFIYSWGGEKIFDSLGTNYLPDGKTINIPENTIWVNAIGEGSMSSIKSISTADYGSNVVTDVFALSPSRSETISLSLGETFDLYVIAQYTSGEEKDIIGGILASEIPYDSFSISIPSYLSFVPPSSE